MVYNNPLPLFSLIKTSQFLGQIQVQIPHPAGWGLWQFQKWTVDRQVDSLDIDLAFSKFERHCDSVLLISSAQE